MDQYLVFDSYHPLEQKLVVIRTLNRQAVNMPTKKEGEEKEQKHIRGALKTYKPLKDPEQRQRRRHLHSYDAGASEKLRRIFNKHHILGHFKLAHPKDKTPRNKQSNVVFAV